MVRDPGVVAGRCVSIMQTFDRRSETMRADRLHSGSRSRDTRRYENLRRRRRFVSEQAMAMESEKRWPPFLLGWRLRRIGAELGEIERGRCYVGHRTDGGGQ